MTVQSRPESHETCPHCAFVGPLGHFRALSQPLGGAASPVRFQKRAPRLNPEPPPPAPLSQPQAPQFYAPQPQQQPHVPTLQLPAQPAQTIAAWQNAAPAPAASQPAPTASLFHQPPGVLFTSQPHSAPQFQLPTQPPAPTAQSAAQSFASPQLWPGLGIEPSSCEAPSQPPQTIANHRKQLPASPGVPAQWQPQDMPVIAPQKKSRVGFWLAAASLVIAAVAITALLAREKILQRIKDLRDAKTTNAAPTGGARPMPAVATRVDPMEIVNQRVLTGTAMTEAEKLVRQLFDGATTADRLKAIARPDEFQAEVSAMFEDAGARPKLVMLTPITNPPLSLVTAERLPMFKVVTSANKSGALVATTVGENGARLLSWPVFHETHNGLLARYIEAKDKNPKWFHVGLRLFHSFELPEPARSEFHAIDIDGSTDGSGHIVTYVAKESPLGRRFSEILEWDKFYFGRVLVSWMEIAGEIRPALLDYEGALLPPAKEKEATR